MMAEKTFIVTVDDVNYEVRRFTFGLRTKIAHTYWKLTNGDDTLLPIEETTQIWAMAYIQNAIIGDEFRDLEDTAYDETILIKIAKIYSEVQKTEDSFRKQSTEDKGNSKEVSG